MSDAVIHARGLSKTFRNGIVAVNGFDLRVEQGTVYGLIGRNGAGKTTALKLLMGLSQPDQGESQVLGRPLWNAPPEHRQKVAYVSQSQQVPEWMSLADLGRYSSHFYTAWRQDMLTEQARRWELPLNQPVSSLSGGNQRLAALALALATQPEVLLLDEPAAGLDPVARRELNVCLVDAMLRGDGCTILLSTHLLGDLERLATHVGIMDRGRILAEGTVEDWQRTMRRVQVVFPDDAPPAGLAIPGAVRSRVLGPVLTALVRMDDEAQLDSIRALPGARLRVFPLTLEELFVDWFNEAAGEPFDDGDKISGQPGDRVQDAPDNRVGKRAT
jgi:ABC-2 type transport system ATP-binding protein